ncbi:hypothetical protein F4821DRAFT_269105 [Hypoxylon rubiginosum]|uniref:Uncharacterized protein n=1 Tax=Hypoxylon rubiginosum TaxID=110542 RepID=A0ACC0D6K3_9PEZI|nr:hypothetical protein F4821DRAFT_269105 [Hypoxylon rubiginosum]
MTLAYYPSNVRERVPAKVFAKAQLLTQDTRYADIGYEFDEKKFLERTAARLQARDSRGDLPEGWPRVLHGPLVWTGSDFSDESRFVYHLSGCDKADIKNALAYFKSKCLGRKGSDVDESSFPLRSLGKTLSTIRTDVYEGVGFATIRGLEVEEFSHDDLVTIYLGITSYVAEKRGKQNQEGVMMTDKGKVNVINNSDVVESPLLTYQPFHTDLVCDTVALLTVSCGKSGGSGFVASAWTVYNELAATRPDLIRVLAEPNWPFDTHGRNPPFYERALLYFEDGRLLTNFSKQSLVGQKPISPRTPGIPGLSEAQAEALDALHAVGRRYEFRQSMEKGDIRFFNNLALMHRRDTYTDSPENYRHLLRLWLHSESVCWKLPADLQLAWDRTFKDNDRKERCCGSTPIGEGYRRVGVG